MIKIDGSGTTLFDFEEIVSDILQKERSLCLESVSTAVTFPSLWQHSSACGPCVHAHLWDELVVVGQVCPAVDAAVGAVARWQVSLEGLRLGHLHHVSGAGLLAGVRAGTGRVAALLDLLTEETLEDASKSRRCCGVGVWHAPHRHHRRKSNLQEVKGEESMWWGTIKVDWNANTTAASLISLDYGHQLYDHKCDIMLSQLTLQRQKSSNICKIKSLMKGGSVYIQRFTSYQHILGNTQP